MTDGTPIIANMRVIKSAEELNMIRQAGQVAIAMGIGGRDAMAVGVPEYEVSLACINAGTRKAAEIIGAEDQDCAHESDDPQSSGGTIRAISPVIHTCIRG